eukprot:TRINITY_DN14362_c0_g2_i1.p1 TRINITY_DN14362_c0_g2~~TRINITY_DN14362_c0_g2_i1.p1  ORF type:complete len:274 (-),score=34.65 TRINITY_DN14362_c0_g2_i1:85-906(-)
MAHVSCAFTSPEPSRSAAGTIDFPPGLALAVGPPPGLSCEAAMQSLSGLQMQRDPEEAVVASVASCQLNGIGLPPGLALSDCDAAFALSNKSIGSSDQSTASDGFASDTSPGDHHDGCSSCGDSVSVEDGPEMPSRLNADAPAFTPISLSREPLGLDAPDLTSPWYPWSCEVRQQDLSMTPMKINAGIAVHDAHAATDGCDAHSKATDRPAQIVPATSWLAAARAAMPQPMLCSKATIARPRAERCKRSTLESEVQRASPSWAAVVKGRTGAA